MSKSREERIVAALGWTKKDKEWYFPGGEIVASHQDCLKGYLEQLNREGLPEEIRQRVKELCREQGINLWVWYSTMDDGGSFYTQRYGEPMQCWFHFTAKQPNLHKQPTEDGAWEEALLRLGERIKSDNTEGSW